MTRNGENLCQGYLADQCLRELLEKVDSDLAEKVRKGGCQHCPGKLHRADNQRKPRGGPKKDEETYRDSFCCDQEGCRKRHTPPSVRFLGRKVYWGLVVILISAMRHGLKPERVQALRQSLGMDRRTLEHWRAWWLETFGQSSFGKAARARFLPRLCESTLPLSLWEAFGLERHDRWLDLLQILSPLTSGSVSEEGAFGGRFFFPQRMPTDPSRAAAVESSLATPVVGKSEKIDLLQISVKPRFRAKVHRKWHSRFGRAFGGKKEQTPLPNDHIHRM